MEKRSLFYPLDQEDLTTLRLQYDWKTGNVFLQASKDWDPDLDWSKYNHDFYVESIKTHNAKFLNDVETRARFEKYGLTDYLEEVIDLLRQGKHFGIDCFYHKGFDIKYLGNMHNRKRGINNTRPETYRALIKPAHMRIVQAVVDRGVIFQMHSCGKCESVVPDFVEIGAKMWHSAQPLNDLVSLLDRFKGKLAIDGGWNTSGPASRIDASEELVREETRRCLTQYKTPGYIFTPALMNERGNAFFVGDERIDAVIDEWMKHREF